MRLFWALIAREVRLALRHGADTVASLLFFLVVSALFPLALGPEPALLGRMAPGIVWAGGLLAAVLPLERLFGADFEDGSLDLLVLSGLAPAGVGMAKAAAHWLVTGVPLLAMAGPVAVMLQLPRAQMPELLGGLALGTAALSLLGTAGAAIVVGARRAAVLLPLLVLPLSTPVVIFGAGAADPAQSAAGRRQSLLFEGAFLALCAGICPLAAGAALRVALD